MKNLIFIIIVFISCSGYQSYEKLNDNKIKLDSSRWYQMSHTESGIQELFDEKLSSTVSVGKKVSSLIMKFTILYWMEKQL